ncbi:Uncharacterised protein [Mobiluncus curtisii]|uniref:Uncharacterized protein n=1 Tax=Mobiluncus curtisii TaxID=2051 RepID=A0A2X3BZU1_9ACTO|nr:Uncharacterised protein [Mobiluncus curtisii]
MRQVVVVGHTDEVIHGMQFLPGVVRVMHPGDTHAQFKAQVLVITATLLRLSPGVHGRRESSARRGKRRPGLWQ